jgi:hypothetical protein
MSYENCAYGAEQDFIVSKRRRHCRPNKEETTMRREEAVRWYEREYWPYAADRKMVGEYAALFKQVKWQLFCTFTFGKALAKPVADEMANSLFAEFINRLEATTKADIIYVRGDEKRFSGCGKPGCGRHFHVVLTSAAPLIPAVVKWHWKEVAGSWDDGADVQPYDASLAGVRYVLKMLTQLHGDWTFRNLHLVFPVSEEMLTCQKRRQLRRHAARMKSFADVKIPDLAAAMAPKPVDPAILSWYEQML